MEALFCRPRMLIGEVTAELGLLIAVGVVGF